MEKERFNHAATGVDDEVSYSTQQMQRGARSLLKAMARLDGKSTGETVSKLIWEAANERLNPASIQLVLKVDGIDYTPE